MGSISQGPASLVGQVIAGYRLERILGIGATGGVFLGQRVSADQALPEQAAVKILILPWQLDTAEREKFRARFEREAETLRRLNDPQHPHHLVPVLASGEDAGFTYIVLPYMSGGTLVGQITGRATPLPLADVARYLTQLADALDFAHSHHIVHRDIKPANVLLDGQGQAFLADFSIVHLIQSTGTGLTSTGSVLGTFPYMAPEQFTGDPITPATDIYSLGILAYEMVTGHLPFQADVPGDLLLQHILEIPPAPFQARSELPPPASVAIQRALAKVPANRYASAGDFARAFALGLQGQGPAVIAPEALAPDLSALRKSPNIRAGLQETPDSMSGSASSPTPGSNPAHAVPATPTPALSSVSSVSSVAAQRPSQRDTRRSAIVPGLAALLVVVLLGGVLANIAGIRFGAPSLVGLLGIGGIDVAPTSTSTSGLLGDSTSVAQATSTRSAQHTPNAKPTARSTAKPTVQPTARPTAVPTARPTATRTPLPQTSLGFCGLCSNRQGQLCNSGNPAPYSASGDLQNETGNASAHWTLTLTPSGWSASPSSGDLGPNASVQITISSPDGLFNGQTLVAHFTCDDGSGTPCQVGGWQSVGPC